MKILSIICVLCSSLIALGQSTSNPFDIPERLGNQELADTMTTAVKDTNIFDIDRPELPEHETVLDISATEVFQTDLSLVSEYIPANGDNPFEVDHVPIRKRKFQPKKNKSSGTLKADNIKDQNNSAPLFIFWFSLLSALILAIVINSDRKVLPSISKSILNENILKLTQREEQNGISGIYLMLYTIYFINAASFVYLLSKHVYEGSPLKFWFILFLIVVVVYLIRHLFMYLISHFFPFKKEVIQYNFTIITFNIFIGISLIALNLLLAYSPDAVSAFTMYLTLLFVGALLLIRVIRGLFTGLSFLASNPIHFLLYLCAFELAPILIMYKFVVNMGV